jgi:hypothetical protein
MGNNPATRRIGKIVEQPRYSVYDEYAEHNDEYDDFNEAVEACDEMQKKYESNCYVYDSYENREVYHTS